jgi:carotenoid 1,2-hydratase
VSTLLRVPRPALAAPRLAFDVEVPPDGYRWWYVDALDEGGNHGCTIIAFVGSVFSPYYARARRRGPTDPLDHCALNVGLYGPRAHRWAMTERSRRHVERTADRFVVGPSALDWDGTRLKIAIDEWTVPIPGRLRGTVTVYPETLGRASWRLDAAGRHAWTPFAPRARVEVDLSEPALRWRGTGYLDSNAGDEPLERGFARWTWSRADLGDGAAVLYDVECRDGSASSLALHFAADGSAAEFAAPPVAPLPRAAWWRMPRATRSEHGRAPRVVATFEDTPFYARSLVESRLFGRRALSVHESLALDRFASPVVQAMLPFRMPRR